MNFDDVIGQLDKFTNEERTEIILETFMKTFGQVKDEIGMSDTEFARLRKWAETKAIPEAMKIYLKRMTEEELDAALRFLRSDVGQAMASCEVEVNKRFQAMFQLAIPSIMDPLED